MNMATGMFRTNDGSVQVDYDGNSIPIPRSKYEKNGGGACQYVRRWWWRHRLQHDSAMLQHHRCSARAPEWKIVRSSRQRSDGRQVYRFGNRSISARPSAWISASAGRQTRNEPQTSNISLKMTAQPCWRAISLWISRSTRRAGAHSMRYEGDRFRSGPSMASAFPCNFTSVVNLLPTGG
jgi:hypothetical protein